MFLGGWEKQVGTNGLRSLACLNLEVGNSFKANNKDTETSYDWIEIKFCLVLAYLITKYKNASTYFKFAKIHFQFSQIFL